MSRQLSTILKRLLLFLVTGSISVVIAACYGVPIAMQNFKSWIPDSARNS